MFGATDGALISFPPPKSTRSLLSCMHRPVQPKNISFQKEVGNAHLYTLQHPHSRAARDEGANVSPSAARDEGAKVEIKGAEAEMKPLP